MNVAIFFIVGHSKKNSTRQHRLLLAEFFYNWLNANVAKTKKNNEKSLNTGIYGYFFIFLSASQNRIFWLKLVNYFI